MKPSTWKIRVLKWDKREKREGNKGNTSRMFSGTEDLFIEWKGTPSGQDIGLK